MKRVSLTNDVSADFLKAARTLVSFMVVLSIVMPWTERFWHFDKFILTGQDFEFGCLGLACILALILLISAHCKQALAFILTPWQWLPTSIRKQAGDLTFAGSSEVIFALDQSQPTSAVLRLYNLPLQV